MLVFADVLEKDGTPVRRRHAGPAQELPDQLYQKDGTVCNAANEIEGFLFKGRDAERHYHETGHFEFISTGGYYHSLPGDALRPFIDTAAEVQRAMGFANEKDHPGGGAVAVRDELLATPRPASPPTRCCSTS